jgi:Tfp pilus assembly protein PilF
VKVASPDQVQEGRDAFIQALIGMGAEKHSEALASIEKALKVDPNNTEYLATRELIQQNVKKSK